MKRFKFHPPVVFDTDCISSFLWVKRLDLPESLFPGQILIPRQVMAELENLKRFTYYAWVPKLLESKIQTGDFGLVDIPAVNGMVKEYLALTRRMGSGEAAALTLVRSVGGTVASNNCKDVQTYCEQNRLELIRTEEILCLAVVRGKITESEGNILWNDMKKTKRKLPGYDFSEALRRYECCCV